MYLAVNKDNDDLYIERIEHDQEFAERLLEKAGRIIFAPVPPERLSADPSWYLCRFCDHAALCHQAGAAAVNCRTCIDATPVMGGWHCQRQDCSLTEADQRQACRRHLYLPPLVPAEQIDAGEDWVLYRCPDGSTWRDSGFNKFAEPAGVSP